MRSYFNDDLVGAEFSGLEAAYKHIQIEALKAGFEVGCSQSFESVHGKIYCLKGGRKRGERSSKTGCQWAVKLGTAGHNHAVKVTHVSLEHNHECHPDLYSVFTCGEREQDLIRKMHQVAIPPRKIAELMELIGVEGITSGQVRRLIDRDTGHLEDGVTESSELQDYVERNQGAFYAMKTSVGEREYCQGCLSIMPFEMENLERFASVLFIDGTQNTSRLGWELVPITLIDQYRRIRSGGVAFLACTDEESICWLLETLASIPPVQENTKTIITDEDSAFIPAFQSVQEHWPINHVLCAYHKEQNFVRKLSKCGLTAVERELARDLFKVVCYSTHRTAVDKALAELRTMHSKLDAYLQEHVQPVLQQFSRAYLCDVWTKGYNTTSPAESHNAMYKNCASGRAVSLKQMRIDYTQAHLEAEKNFNERIIRSFTNDHFTFEIGSLMLSPKIRDLIDEINSDADKLCLTLCDGKPECFKVFHPSSADLFHEATVESCTCGRLTHEGLPCAHILRVISEVCGQNFDEWPFALINEDWVIESEDHVLVPFDRDGNVNDSEMEDPPQQEMAEGDIVCDADELTVDGGHILVDEDVLQMSTNIPLYKQRKRRYLRLYHLMKSVVSLASRGARTSQTLMLELNRIKAELLDIPPRDPEFPPEFREEEEQHEEETGVPPIMDEPTLAAEEGSDVPVDRVDVQDVIGKRRGRKKKRVRETYVSRRSESCFLCGGRHLLVHCEKYGEYSAAREHNESQPDQVGRGRCRVCAGYGHNSKTCAWLWSNQKKRKG